MNNISKISKDKCNGCSACYNSCLKNAIIMKKDEEGFLYPEIQNDKCINCGKCLNVCPNFNLKKVNVDEVAFACYAKDINQHMISSSGGFFAEAAKYILSKNGTIYGAAFNTNMEVEHIGINRIEDLNKLVGTKYVQSRIGGCFNLIKDDLRRDKYVLFSGTPCQVAGLKKFLNRDYDKLVCIDLICHGVPSPEVWSRYIAEKFETRKVTNMKFRNKENGIQKVLLQFELDDGELYSEAYRDCSYIQGFINNFYTRRSCFSCDFKGKNRYSDVTIGDFWSINEFHREMTSKYGVSAVIAHTNKGKALIEDISKNLKICDAKSTEIAVWNESLNEPAKLTKYRSMFYSLWQDETVENVIKNLMTIKEKNQTENKCFFKKMYERIRKWLV